MHWTLILLQTHVGQTIERAKARDIRFLIIEKLKRLTDEGRRIFP